MAKAGRLINEELGDWWKLFSSILSYYTSIHLEDLKTVTKIS
jgi:hypothetical protein